MNQEWLKVNINKTKVNEEITPSNHSFSNNQQLNGEYTTRKLGILTSVQAS